jgi:hypothetical protein
MLFLIACVKSIQLNAGVKQSQMYLCVCGLFYDCVRVPSNDRMMPNTVTAWSKEWVLAAGMLGLQFELHSRHGRLSSCVCVVDVEALGVELIPRPGVLPTVETDF